MAGCSDTSELTLAELEKAGLTGKHQLRRIEHSAGGKMDGAFFIGTGSINGSMDEKLRFYWERGDGSIWASTLDYGLFQFIVDDSKEVPEIEFVFNHAWLNFHGSIGNNGPTMSAGAMENPNNALKGEDALGIVKVYISQAALEKEIYLPR